MSDLLGEIILWGFLPPAGIALSVALIKDQDRECNGLLPPGQLQASHTDTRDVIASLRESRDSGKSSQF